MTFSSKGSTREKGNRAVYVSTKKVKSRYDGNVERGA